MEDDAVNLFFDKKSILTHYGASLSITDTFRRPSIGRLVKTNGEDSMLVFVTGLLNEFLSFVPNALSADEIVMYADKIIAHCPQWNTADLVLCLKNGMDGKYGPIKFRWTWSSDFVVWMEKYDEDKYKWRHVDHLEKKKNGIMADENLIKIFPKEIINQLLKQSFVDQEKRKLLDIPIPKEIVAQGKVAIDEYIDQSRKNKKP